MRKYSPFIIVFILTIMGVVLRFSSLTAREFWYDEAFSGLLIQLDWRTMWHHIEMDVHPFFYYAVLKIWSAIFGANDFSLRNFSTLFGIALIPLSYVFLRMAYHSSHRRVLFIAPFLFAVSPFFIRYSQETRMYTLLAVLMLFSGLFFFRAITSSPFRFNRDWFFFSVFAGIAFMTHYIAAFGIISYYLFMILYWIQNHHLIKKRSQFAALCKTQLLTILPAIAVFSPWLTGFLFQLIRAKSLGWIPVAHISFIPRSIYAFLFGVDTHAMGVPPVHELFSTISAQSIAFVLTSVLIITIFISYRRLNIRQKNLFQFTFIAGITPLLFIIITSWLGVHLYVERYLLPYGMWIMLLISQCIGTCSKTIITVSAMLYIAVILRIPPLPPNEGFRDFGAELQRSYTEAPHIIMTDPNAFFMTRYYAGKLEPRIRLYDEQNAQNVTTWALVPYGTVYILPTSIQSQDIIVDRPPLHATVTASMQPLSSFQQFLFYQAP